MRGIKLEKASRYRSRLRFAPFLAIVAAVGLLGCPAAYAQGTQCESDGTSFSCELDNRGMVVCTPKSHEGKLRIDELASCVAANYGTGADPLVTIAAFGGGAEATPSNKAWNGGTAFTTHRLAELKAELGGAPLYFEVAKPRIESKASGAKPGQATVVATKPIGGPDKLQKLSGRETVLVAAGGGAHGQVIPGSLVEDARGGGLGGYADGWFGSPCPYTRGGVCGSGQRGRSAIGASGGYGGTESVNAKSLEFRDNGVAEVAAWGGHGGAGHPQGGGGDAISGNRLAAAAGGGGGGSFAWRSTRATPQGLESVLRRQPGVEFVFQRGGRTSQIEWQAATFTADDAEGHDIKAIQGTATISVIVDDPGAMKTELDLDGLVLLDRVDDNGRQIEPYRITEVANLGQNFTTTERSKVLFRIYDQHGTPIGHGMTGAAASLRLDESLQLFFRLGESGGARGEVAVFAQSKDGRVARAHP
ncbi:MAG: hypothetical protein AAF997_04540 [Myxococcota bacterium]